jgi:eukaryotic-like serine/threonine-protein kinase
VEHAHHQLVLHRDLKPSNVLVTADGQVKLLDFGIAGVLDDDADAPMTKLTQLTGRGLTLEYASPEQITGEPTMPASDVYSLGVLLFHLCTGNRPFATSSTRAALEYAVVHTDPPLASESLTMAKNAQGIADSIAPPPDAKRLRGDLDAIIRRAMRLNPSERYPTAARLAADLEAWMSNRPISLHAGERGYVAKLWLRRHWQVVAIASAATIAVVAALGVSLWQRSNAIDVAEAAVMRSANLVARLPSLADANSEPALTIRLHHAQLLRATGRAAESLKELDQIAPAISNLHGASSSNHKALLLARVAALEDLGRGEEAKKIAAQAAAISDRR